MKTLALVAFLFLVGCSRAEWQETPSPGPAAQEEKKPEPAPFPELLKFADCQSQILNVTVDTSTSQIGLRDFKTVAARYPLIRVTRASKTKEKVVFFLNPRDSKKHACVDETCAEEAGWSQIQDDLRDMNGIQLSCEGASPI